MSFQFVVLVACLLLLGGFVFSSPDSKCVCVPRSQCSSLNSVKDSRKCKPMETCCLNPSPKTRDEDIHVPKAPNGGGCGLKRHAQHILLKRTSDSTVSENTFFGEFPWTVQIRDNDRAICTGSLIAPNYVVTAPYCLKNRVSVRVGEWDDKISDEPIPHQDIEVKEILYSPDYNASNKVQTHPSLAILVLKTPAKLSESVDTICLPDETTTYGSPCIATGWNGRPDEKAGMLRIEQPPMDRKECEDRLRKIGPFRSLSPEFRLPDGYFCRGNPEKELYAGFGGGPLVCPSTGNPDKYFQIGVVSYGTRIGSETPIEVYTSVKHYADWIKEVVNRKTA